MGEMHEETRNGEWAGKHYEERCFSPNASLRLYNRRNMNSGQAFSISVSASVPHLFCFGWGMQRSDQLCNYAEAQVDTPGRLRIYAALNAIPSEGI